MKAGKPKSDKTKKSARGGPENQSNDRTRGLDKKTAAAAPKRESKLLALLLLDTRLSDCDRERITAAAEQSIDTTDLAVLITYQIVHVMNAREDGEVDAKATIVALNKISSLAAAAAQLSGAGAGGKGANINVTFSHAGLPVADGAPSRADPGVTGDQIDVEA